MHLFRLAIVLLFFASLPVAATSVDAQTKSSPFYTQADGAGGVRMFRSGTWGRVAVELVNPTDQPVTLVPTFQVDGADLVQYAAETWLPSRSQLSVSYPVFIPPGLNAESDSEQVPVRTLLFQRTQENGDVLIEDRTGEKFRRGLIIVQKRKPLAAIIGGQQNEAVRHAARAMNVANGGPSTVPNLAADDLPPTPDSLDPLDMLVIAGDELRDDPAALTAVRRWLIDGGQLWIMLDQIEYATVNAILGDQFRGTVVDRAELTTVDLQDVATPAGRNSEFRDYDIPVEMVRTIIPDARPLFTVDGWPAAFWIPYGRGMVLVTTLDPRAWYRDANESDKQDPNFSRGVKHMATEPLAHLGRGLLEPRTVPQLQPELMRTALAEEIGYEIISSGTVSAILGLFCLALLAGGAWFFSRGALHHLGWFGPVIAVGAALLLVLLGWQTRDAVPPTVATLQVVDLVPGDSEAVVRGQMAIYSPSSYDALLGAEQGGLFGDENSLGGDGKSPRMTFIDLEAWKLENFTLAAGVTIVPFQYATQLEQPVEVNARFGPQGLEGSIVAGPFVDLSDAVIATNSSTRSAVTLDESGSFSVTPADALASEQFIAANLVDDRRRRRGLMLADMLNPPDSPGYYPQQPVLLTWAAPFEMDFQLPPDSESTGDALLTIPVRLRQTPPGGQVLLGPSFLPFETVPAPGKQSAAPTYDNVRKLWIGPVSKETETYVRFQLPESVLPLEVNEARLRITINAPGRELTIRGVQEENGFDLATRSSPVGTIDFEFTDKTALQPDANGGLVLGIIVGKFGGESDNSISASGWMIEDVRLELSGKALADDAAQP